MSSRKLQWSQTKWKDSALGNALIDVYLRTAAQLYSPKVDSTPVAFVNAKSETDTKLKKPATAATNAGAPGTTTSWNEVLRIEIPSDAIFSDEKLLLTVAAQQAYVKKLQDIASRGTVYHQQQQIIEKLTKLIHGMRSDQPISSVDTNAAVADQQRLIKLERDNEALRQKNEILERELQTVQLELANRKGDSDQSSRAFARVLASLRIQIAEAEAGVHVGGSMPHTDDLHATSICERPRSPAAPFSHS
eukprot:Clim_evm25s214 gene=Clim_evmTU25s214